MKSALKYPGAKWSIADWIIGFFPEHHSYLEPFFGSGAVLFRKSRSNIETVNDLDGEVVNLFECIKNDPEKMARMIYLTPYSRQIYEEAYTKTKSDFERALGFFIRCNMGHGYRTTGEKVGWKNDVQGRERAYAAKYWQTLPAEIVAIAERLRGIQIDNRPAQELIPRFNHPNVLIYADPPYMLSTRHGKQYRCEMNDYDHMELLEILLAHKGFVVLSGYESDLYNKALKGWSKKNIISYSQVASKKQEVLWMNFEPLDQIRLFDVTENVDSNRRVNHGCNAVFNYNISIR